MLAGYFSGASGLHYSSQKLEVVSNNLSNANTTGYRRSSFVVRNREPNQRTKWVDSAVRERNPVFNGLQRTGIYKIYGETGPLQATGNNMDIAIPPELKNAFFAVRRAGENDRNTYYTRNGGLTIGFEQPDNPESQSVLYLGGHIALDSTNQPIPINASGGQINIGSDGSVRQGDTPLGELPVYRLNKSNDPNVQAGANLQLLSQMGDSLFKIPDEFSSEINPYRLESGVGNVTRVVSQGVRESSNVNSIDQLLTMMEAKGEYSSNTSAITKQMEGLTKLFQLVRS
jgi:flagellar basal body rod protein FlgG